MIIRILLSPFALLYGLVVWIRNRLYDIKWLKSFRFGIPVIVVGNITVGGTGKTPHIEYLIHLLHADSSVMALSRGYKRKTKGFLKADQQSGWKEIGDEPFQIKQKFPLIDVAVDANRVRGILTLMHEEKEKPVILLDDGFQHRSVHPGLSLLLIDYSHPLSEDFYLPAGKLREHKKERRRADIILITKSPPAISAEEERKRIALLHPFPHQKVFFTTLKYLPPVPLFRTTDNEQHKPGILEHFSTLLLVTGIANPDPLISYLQQEVKHLRVISYPDHHSFRPKDIKKICGIFAEISFMDKAIITTEKDAVRLRHMGREHFLFPERWFVIAVEVGFISPAAQKVFNETIHAYVGKN